MSDNRPLSVTVICELDHIPKPVFFYPALIDGELYLDIESFTGCDSDFRSCPQCKACKQKAYSKLMC